MRRHGKNAQEPAENRNKRVNEVAKKLFAILEVLSQQPKSGVLLEEITKISRLSKPTAHRLLYSMKQLGYVDQDPSSTAYSLAGKFFDLGADALPYQRLKTVAKPLIQTLFLTFGESVNLAVVRGGVAMYIYVVESTKPHRVAASVGNFSLLHCTSVGKCMAAHMPPEELEKSLTQQGMPAITSATITSRTALDEQLAQVRQEGVALDLEENNEGITCVGGPIFASEGRLVGALSVSAPTNRMSRNLAAVKVAVRETVQKISLLLGHDIIPSPETVSSELGRGAF